MESLARDAVASLFPSTSASPGPSAAGRDRVEDHGHRRPPARSPQSLGDVAGTPTPSSTASPTNTPTPSNTTWPTGTPTRVGTLTPPEAPSPAEANRAADLAALVDGLNPPQREAVLHEGSPLLVVAGETVFALPFHVARFFRPILLDVSGLTATELGTAQGVYGAIAMIAYFPGGPLADRFMEPAMEPGGSLAGALGWLVGVGSGAGMSLAVLLAGLVVALVGLGGFFVPAIRSVEDALAKARELVA